MKKIIFVILLTALIPALFSCARGTGAVGSTNTADPTDSIVGANTDEPVGAVTEDEPDTEPTAAAPVRLTIAGGDLSEYTIVYADAPYEAKIVDKFTTEYDFFRLIAEDISEKIYARTGVRLLLARDTESKAGKSEILVGPTNRAESRALDGMDVYRTCVRVTGSKLVVGGGYDSTVYTGNLRKSYCFASTYHAWDAVDEYLNKAISEGDTSVDLPAGTDLSGSVALITVACIGDSITEGAGSTVRDYHAYPAVLGRILWRDHLIINLGNSGKTMRDDLSNHYRSTTQHAAMKRYSHKFDYALIMLGTNDSYFDRSWPSSSDEKYLTSAGNLVHDITRMNDGVQVVIMNCPAYFGTNGSGSPHVRELQGMLPDILSAKGVNTSFFNMYEITLKKVGSKNFPDQLHPNDAGHAIMAESVADMLRGLADGSYTYTLPKE